MGASPLSSLPWIRHCQRSAAFIRRSIRQGFCAPDFAIFSDIIDHADDDLFKQILSNPNYVLAPLLPDKTGSHYSLRSRPHDRQLIPKLTKLYDSNFIVCMLYINKNLCGRDGRTICGPERVPKSTCVSM